MGCRIFRSATTKVPAGFLCVDQSLPPGQCPDPVPFDDDGDGEEDEYGCGTRVTWNIEVQKCTTIGAQDGDHCKTMDQRAVCAKKRFCILEGDLCVPFGTNEVWIWHYVVQNTTVDCSINHDPSPTGGST
jgi:hypothetical protein